MSDVQWRVSDDVARRFRDLLLRLRELGDHDPATLQILDDIRSLPNFPHGADPNRDLIHLVGTTERSR